MEPVKLTVMGVTKSTVTFVWEWQKKSRPIRVNRYRVMLRKDSEIQSRFMKEFSSEMCHRVYCSDYLQHLTVKVFLKHMCELFFFRNCVCSTEIVLSFPALSLWPDQSQHTLINLKPNTEYSLLLLADNVSRDIIPVRTDFGEYNWLFWRFCLALDPNLKATIGCQRRISRSQVWFLRA